MYRQHKTPYKKFKFASQIFLVPFFPFISQAQKNLLINAFNYIFRINSFSIKVSALQMIAFEFVHDLFEKQVSLPNRMSFRFSRAYISMVHISSLQFVKSIKFSSTVYVFSKMISFFASDRYLYC